MFLSFMFNEKLLVQQYDTLLIHSALSFFQFNFIGRLLGPRGKSLKRIEACTNCRVFIRGKGSIKDSSKVSAQYYGTRQLQLCISSLKGFCL
jgi:hypothetical protein